MEARGAERALEVDWAIIVQRCLDGDSLAWTELVRFHHRRIYALCYRFTGSPHDAEDLTQQRVTDSIDAGWEQIDELPLAARLAASGPTQHDRAVQAEIARMVQEALTRLSPELREAVILRDLQDMDYKEIAQVLRIPEGTVKSRISRGRAELARLLERNKGQVV
jgi:RNA polymerase sigma-70 factor (ECF subfamily)